MANNVPVSAKTALLQRAIVARPASAISIKLSLMTTAAGNARDAYSSTNECSATGYTARATAKSSSPQTRDTRCRVRTSSRADSTFARMRSVGNGF